MVSGDELRYFLRESLRIEGIMREPTENELGTTAEFLALQSVTVTDTICLVKVYQPSAKLRDEPGLNVRVGNHIAPPGGPVIPSELARILTSASEGLDPWEIHCWYETLHPFTDGNGRSGRALWA